MKIFSPKNSDKIQEGLAKRNFAQTYQIINELSSPIKDLYSWVSTKYVHLYFRTLQNPHFILKKVNIPTHFKNVELVEVQSVQLNLIGCDRDKTVNVNAESENPKDFSCSTKDVKCVTYRFCWNILKHMVEKSGPNIICLSHVDVRNLNWKAITAVMHPC